MNEAEEFICAVTYVLLHVYEWRFYDETYRF